MKVEREIRAAEARAVFRTPLGLLTSSIIAALSVGVLWPAVPRVLLLSWMLALGLCLGARLLLWRAYRAKQPPQATDIGRWVNWFTAGTALSGTLWGLVALVVPINDDPVNHIFVVMVLAGMAAGAIAALAPCLPALYAFLVPLGLELAAALVLHGGTAYLAMGAMVLVFIASIHPRQCTRRDQLKGPRASLRGAQQAVRGLVRCHERAATGPHAAGRRYRRRIRCADG